MTKKYALMKAGSPDNFQTDPVALDCLVPHVPKKWEIWECAAGNGNLANSLSDRGYSVYRSDILGGDDFLTKKPWPFDCIITNPPFSLKEEFLGRCYQLGKPFALLLPLTTFDSVERRKLFDQHGIQLIFPAKRINFETPNHAKNVAKGKKTTAWFYSAWFTWGLSLPRDLNFSEPKSLGI